MATINLGGPSLNIDDKIVNDYIGQYKSGSLSLDQAGEGILNAARQASTGTRDAQGYLSGPDSYLNFAYGDLAKPYLEKILQGQPLPITYAPGSLQSGQTPMVTQGQPTPVAAGPISTSSMGVGATNGSSGTSTNGSATNLGTAPINVPNVPKGPSESDTLLAGIEQSQKDQLAALNNTQNQQKADSLTSEISSLLPTLEGRGAAQLASEQQYGVNDIKSQLTDINGQISSKMAEYKNIQAQYDALSVEQEGKPITMASIIGSQAQIQRQLDSKKNVFASEIGLLQAQGSALQGRLTDAQNMANRAVDLKYQDAQAAIDVRLQQLQLIQPYLTQEQQQKAQLQQNIFTLQRDQIANTISTEKDQNSLLLNFIQKYPDAGITMSDNLATAQAKITQNSKVFGKESAANNSTATFEDGTGQYLLTYDNNGNVVNKVKVGESTKKANGLTEVSPGSTLYNTSTGKAEYTAPTTDIQNATASQPVSTRQPTTQELLDAYKANGGKPLTSEQWAKLYGTTSTPVNTGKVITTPGVPQGLTQSAISEIDNAMRTGSVSGQKIGNPVGSDGYIDPANYVTMLNYWTQQGGTKQSFLDKFPVKIYINPANTWVWDQIGIKNPNAKGNSTDYTDTEKRKLEQAGLLNASRQDQLDFLYGETIPVPKFKTQE